VEVDDEFGHPFLLKDLCLEGNRPAALNRQPNALMGNHWKTQGMIEPDDRPDQFAVIDGLQSVKITNCAKGYKTINNSIDCRFHGKLYSIPTSDFINEVDMREPDFSEPTHYRKCKRILRLS